MQFSHRENFVAHSFISFFSILTFHTVKVEIAEKNKMKSNIEANHGHSRIDSIRQLIEFTMNLLCCVFFGRPMQCIMNLNYS